MINLRPHVLSKIEKALNEMSYRDAIENSSRYNNRLVVDRKTRMPFIDPQTGVAQRDSLLWMQRWERMPGTSDGQLYTYPSHRWKKKRRSYLLNDNYHFRRRIHDINEASSSNGHDTSVKADNVESMEKYFESSKDAWYYADYEDSTDLLLEGDFDDPESDYDDFDEFTIKKNKKKKKDTAKKKRIDYTDAEKPYQCDICEARYKTRPGLTYHYSHSHQNQNEGDKPSKSSTPVSTIDDDDVRQTPPKNTSTSSNGNNSNPSTQVYGPVNQSTPSNTPNPPTAAKTSQEPSNSSSKKDPVRDEAASDKPLAPPSPYCDFCLGDSEENKKSKSAEKLVSCSDCGRSAHPTCLQFTPHMIISVQKYRWQCIECKSCGICGTSDNDEQLLFCDDCDRGYHMYCLTPPLSEPPEGSWSCHLCIEEYHTPKSSSKS